jgi:hypothetical protein
MKMQWFALTQLALRVTLALPIAQNCLALLTKST